MKDLDHEEYRGNQRPVRGGQHSLEQQRTASRPFRTTHSPACVPRITRNSEPSFSRTRGGRVDTSEHLLLLGKILSR